MGNRGLRGWIRRRMARRLEKKLDLDEIQVAELQSILSGWHTAHSIWCRSTDGAALTGGREEQPLASLIQSRIEAYKLILDEQSMKLIEFTGSLDPVQQERAIVILAKPHHSCG